MPEERIRQPEDAAPIDSQVLRKLAQRDRIARSRHDLQNEQTAVQTLNRWGLKGRFFHRANRTRSRGVSHHIETGMAEDRVEFQRQAAIRPLSILTLALNF